MVLVIDWTAIWAPPPIGTPPTFICRLVVGRSRSAASIISLPSLLRDKRLSGEDFTKVRVGCEQEQHQDERYPQSRDLAHSLLTHGPAQYLLRRDEEEVPAVERQDGQQVEQGQVDADQGQKLREEALLDGGGADGGDAHRPGHVVVDLLLTGDKITHKRSEQAGHPHHLPDRQPQRLQRTVPRPDDLRPDAHQGAVGVAGIGAELAGERLFAPVSLDGHTDLLARTPLCNLAAESFPALYPFSLHSDQPVAQLDANAIAHRALLDLLHLRLHVRDLAGDHQDTSEDGHRRKHVRKRPREDDQSPPPGSLRGKGAGPPRSVIHSRHLRETTQKYYAERVSSCAELLLKDGGAEADPELGDPNAEGLGGEHVSELVDQDQEDQTHYRHHDRHRSAASSLAQASTARIASMLCMVPNSGRASRTPSITSPICKNPIRRSRKD